MAPEFWPAARVREVAHIQDMWRFLQRGRRAKEEARRLTYF
jgi:hypothetical protein